MIGQKDAVHIYRNETFLNYMYWKLYFQVTLFWTIDNRLIKKGIAREHFYSAFLL